MVCGGVVPRLTMPMKKSERGSVSGLIAQVQNGSSGSLELYCKRDQCSVALGRSGKLIYGRNGVLRGIKSRNIGLRSFLSMFGDALFWRFCIISIRPACDPLDVQRVLGVY